MPSTTPELKVLGVRSRGAKALLHGESFPFALAHALQLAEQPGAPLFRRSTTRR
jgi:threonine dehydratase